VPSKPRSRQDLEALHLDGEAVIYDASTGEVHHLNPTAALVFRLCDGTGTVPELASDIADAFGVPEAEVEGQVEALVSEFREAGLLAGSLRLVADPRPATSDAPERSIAPAKEPVGDGHGHDHVQVGAHPDVLDERIDPHTEEPGGT
jgi:PqqD family protein of HPr-rel-A system